MVHYDPGFPPWTGSIFTCPSDIDWHGQKPRLDGIEYIEKITIYSDAGETELEGPRFKAAVRWLEKHLPTDVIEESLREVLGDRIDVSELREDL